MDDFNWIYGNFSLLNEELEIFNTLYIDKASIGNNGLLLFHKDKVIGFINLVSFVGLFKKTYISKTGLLLTNKSFYTDALISLENFVVSEDIVIISQVDYSFKNFKHPSRISSFFGTKKTIVNIIDSDAESWLSKIKKKHRYYVKKGLKIENSRCEISIVDSLDFSFRSNLYDIYAENMSKKGVNLLFSTKDEFIDFIDRNLKNIIITTCYKNNEISYFSVVHTNNEMANYIMAVTTSIGMTSYASYMGIYKLYDYLFHNNFKFLNFGGVDSSINHGVYLFKKGFSGDLLNSPRYMIIGVGLIARIAKRIMQLRFLVKSS